MMKLILIDDDDVQETTVSVWDVTEKPLVRTGSGARSKGEETLYFLSHPEDAGDLVREVIEAIEDWEDQKKVRVG